MRQEFAITHFLTAAKRASPLLWWASVAMLVGMFVCFGLELVDARLIAGVSVWEKPAKFFLSLVVQALTVAWALSLVPQSLRGVKSATWLFIAALIVEMSYMVFRAARGEASHFNQSTVFASIMYAVMGLGAITLTGTSAFIGWRVWQQRKGSLLREAAGLGLMFGAVLGTIAGGYMSAQTSHWVGGLQNDATGLGFFHWSTTGGDLRVAHFIGLHATQAVPLAALSGSRLVVYGMALLCLLFLAATFAMAVMGIPLLRSS
jgi:hypothetical protein